VFERVLTIGWDGKLYEDNYWQNQFFDQYQLNMPVKSSQTFILLLKNQISEIIGINWQIGRFRAANQWKPGKSDRLPVEQYL
jgi:hypothetical protein